MYRARVFYLPSWKPTIIEGFATLDDATRYARLARRQGASIVVVKLGKRICRVI